MPELTPTSTIDRVVADVVDARCRGERVTDEQVMLAHPHLAQDLGEKLKFARYVERARLSCRTAGPAADGPLAILTDVELEDADDNLADDFGLPVVPGYKLAEEVGRGGQGVVYLATPASGGDAVALKILPGGFAASSHARARFRRELRVLSHVEHPGIVAVLDAGRMPDGSLYLVMPFIRGVDLSEHAAGLNGDAEVASLFAAVADAIHAAHERGVVHRDLKPANVRVGADGVPRVLDFGLASVADPAVMGSATPDGRTLTGSDQMVGSLAWTSPEQARGDVGAVDRRSDVYAIGLMLCRAVAAGHAPPYRTEGPGHLVIRDILRARPRVAGRRPFDPLAHVALRCLAKRQARRYQTAADLARDLRRVAAGERVVSRWRRLVTSRAIAVCGAACLVAAGPIAYRYVRPPATHARVETDLYGMQLVPLPGDPALAIGVSQVTWEQYSRVTGSRPASDGQLPVTGISYDEAERFCRQLSAKCHHRYRLPTVAEWRAALPGGPADIGARAWCATNSGGHLHPVETRAANDLGLYDMAGNAWSWCSGGSGDRCPICGGGFGSTAAECQAGASTLRDRSARRVDLGFRVIRDGGDKAP